MLRITMCLAALLVAGSLQTASAQSTTAPAAAPAATDAKPSTMKLTRDKLKDMRAKWSANKPKLKACQKEVKAKGLAGDDRWFYMADCMDKS
jgi:psiF repeat